MLDESDLPMDLPPAAHRALEQVGTCWEDDQQAENHLLYALSQAPDALAMQIGAYKFYFYRHRFGDALPHALNCLSMAARRLQLPHDWRDVQPDHAEFTQISPWPRLFVQCLTAYGYCLLRQGRQMEANEALSKAAALDPTDRFGAGRLLYLLQNPDEDEDEDEDD